MPALSQNNAGSRDDDEEQTSTYWNLPNKQQLAILCLARLTDPLASTSIQSYMFYQLKFFNPTLSDAAISTQAGLIISAKTAAQVCTGVLWGRVADSERYGRRSVLLVGLVGSGIATIGYGLSRSFGAAVFWQIFNGVVNSNVAIVRCTVAELNEEKRHRTRALLLLPLCANAGMLIGPLIGGLLSSQDGHWFLRSFPYLLPNVVVAGMYALAATGVFLFLEETLESRRHDKTSLAQKFSDRLLGFLNSSHRHQQQQHAYSLLPAEEISSSESRSASLELGHSPLLAPPPPPPPPPPTSNLTPLSKPTTKLTFREIYTPAVFSTMLAHFIISGHLGTFTSLWSIFLSTPPGEAHEQHPPFRFNGGLGLQPRDIGFAMSLLGVIAVVLQATLYPSLNDRYGTVAIWRAALFVFPVTYILAPYASLAATPALEKAEGMVPGRVWLAVVGVLCLFVLGRLGVAPATTLLINDCTPDPSVRATIHTTGTVVGNLSRSVFPIVALSIFGRGLEIGVVGLGFWCLAGLAVLACVASRWVREGGSEVVKKKGRGGRG